MKRKCDRIHYGCCCCMPSRRIRSIDSTWRHTIILKLVAITPCSCSPRRCCISPSRRAPCLRSPRRWDTALTRRAPTRSDRNKFKYYCMPSRWIDGTNTTWRHTTTILVRTTQNTTIKHIFLSFRQHWRVIIFSVKFILNWKNDLQKRKKYFRCIFMGKKYYFRILNGKKVLSVEMMWEKVLFLNFKWEKSTSVEIMCNKSTRLFMWNRGKECEYQRFDAVAYYSKVGEIDLCWLPSIPSLFSSIWNKLIWSNLIHFDSDWLDHTSKVL